MSDSVNPYKRERLTQKLARFPAGVSMTVEEVAAVVGPEFQEMNENPPESVLRVREQMEKQAGTGLYGYAKGTQTDVEGATKRLTKQAVAIAKKAYGKDPDVVDFLHKHATRAGSPVASLLLEAMKEIGPKIPDVEPVGTDKTAGALTKNLYGHKTKTAALGIQACGELRLAAGQVCSDLHEKRAAKQADILGYLEKHGSAEGANCKYSSLLRSGYPDMPEPAPATTTKTASAESPVPTTVAGWLSLK